MDGALAGGTIGAQNKEVSPGNNLTGNVVAASWGDLHYLTLVPVTNGYVLKTMTNDYIYHSSNNNAISSTKNIGTASSYYITITYTNSSDIKLCLNGNALGAVLIYNNNNNSSSGGYFRFYKDGGQEAVYLYKRTISATASVPECYAIPFSPAPVLVILRTDN